MWQAIVDASRCSLACVPSFQKRKRTRQKTRRRGWAIQIPWGIQKSDRKKTLYQTGQFDIAFFVYILVACGAQVVPKSAKKGALLLSSAPPFGTCWCGLATFWGHFVKLELPALCWRSQFGVIHNSVSYSIQTTWTEYVPDSPLAYLAEYAPDSPLAYFG